MRRRKTSLLILLPIVLLIIALLIPALVSAAPGNGAVHGLIYHTADQNVNAIYHPQTGNWTITGAVFPKSGPLK